MHPQCGVDYWYSNFFVMLSNWHMEHQHWILLAKVKVTPMETKTLSTLELLAAFLALRCLLTILNAFPSVLSNIIIAVEAQIVLFWLLNGSTKSNSIFVSNKIKNINKMMELIVKFLKKINFKYVLSAQKSWSYY